MANYPSWAWLTGESVSNTNANSFVGYTFDPNAVYKTGNLRDGDEDGRVAPRNSGFYHVNDGWAFEGNAYNSARNWSFGATVTYKDGTTTNITLLASRLVDDDNVATQPYHSTLLLRLPDPQMYRVADGGTDNGDGEYLYNMDDIASITITAYNGETDWQAKQSLDEFWPEAVCFARGTLIQTAHGRVAVEDLREGDMVLTRDDGLQPIRWIGSQTFSAGDLMATPNLKPIRIAAGALGKDTPTADLIVSPQHRILVRSKIAQRMFGTDEVLLAAKQLLELNGIDIVNDAAEVEYFHFLFNKHEIVFANGAEAESLYTGSQALRSVSDAVREEIFAIFPELKNQDYVATSVRPLISGRVARQFAARHAKNSHELLS